MIEPQIHNGQRSIIGAQHGLAKLTETLAALSAGQQAQQTRDTQMQAQLTTQAQALARLQAWSHRLVLTCAALGVLVLTLAGVVGWQVTHPPQLGSVRAVGALDTTLLQVWPTLPKAAQTQLDATYQRLGLASPAQRK